MYMKRQFLLPSARLVFFLISITYMSQHGRCDFEDDGLSFSQAQKDYEPLNSRLDYLRRSNKQKPGQFQTLVMLAATLHHLDHIHPDGGSRIREAEGYYRGAMETAPNVEVASSLQGNLGALLMAAGRVREALETIEDSLDTATAAGHDRTDNFAGAMFNKGKALGMLGREAEAQATYRQAMKAAKGVSPSTWTKCCASLKQVTDNELDEMDAAATFLTYGTGIAAAISSAQHAQQQQTAAQLREVWGWLEHVPPTDRCWLHFALYAAYDGKGEYAKAWDHLRTANQLQKDAQTEEEASQERQLLKALTSIFRQPKAGREAGTYEALLAGQGGFQDETPIFVVGMARSGSTLIEQILASHPQVHGGGEDTALAPLIPELLKALEGEGGQVSLANVARVGQTYVKEMRGRLPPGKQPLRIVDKMLRNAWNVGHIAFMLPKAQVIWAIRHPMDVLLSCFAQPFEGRGTPWAWDLQDIAEQIKLTHKVMEHWESILPGRILRVPYEELVTQKTISRRMLAHCGLRWDPAVLTFHDTARAVQTASLSQVRKKLYRTSMGKWRQYAEYLQPLQQRLRPLVERYEQSLKGVTGHHQSTEEL